MEKKRSKKCSAYNNNITSNQIELMDDSDTKNSDDQWHNPSTYDMCVQILLTIFPIQKLWSSKTSTHTPSSLKP
jgi:hypothetical protein